MKSALALTIVGTLLLTSCNGPDNQIPPTKPAPIDPAAVRPAAPVIGQSLELQDILGTVQKATDQLTALTNPQNPDLDPDLKSLLTLFGGASTVAKSLDGVGSFGRQLAQGSDAQQRLTSQALNAVKVLLTTGTVTIAADGKETRTETPTDGYVEIDQRNNTRIEAKWKVGGAATVFIDSGSRPDPQTGQPQQIQQEVPTNATGSVTVAGKVVASLAFAMTPGDCLNRVGPTALSLSGWAGRATTPPVKVDLKYAWSEQNISLSGSALYSTTKQQASSEVALNITGTTRDRCGDNFAFTPTRADLIGALNIPGYKTDLAVYLRDLSNLTIDAESMKAQNPFQKIGGSVNASLKFNGNAVVTAFGPLADGSDINLQPGDQVKVQYVKNGQMVTTDIEGALKDLQGVLTTRR